VHFSTIGFVASKAVNGNSSQVLEYGYQDAAPGLHNYYRLQQEQLNGQMSYSAIIYVQDLSGAQAGATTVKVFPVPAVDMIRFITNKAGLLLVFDQNGRQVLSRLVSVGENKIGIQQLKSGVYFYRINNQQGRFIKK